LRSRYQEKKFSLLEQRSVEKEETQRELAKAALELACQAARWFPNLQRAKASEKRSASVEKNDVLGVVVRELETDKSKKRR
jgi:hypothetical protein